MSPTEALLQAYLGESRRDFDWRHHNCAHFVSAWVAKAERRHVFAPTSLRQQIRYRDDCGGYAGAVTAALNRAPRDTVAAADVGDILMYRLSGGRVMLGICCGMRAATLAESGVEFVYQLTLSAHMAWRVEVKA